MGDPNNQIRLVGQPSLGTRLRDPSLAQLYQRIAVSYHIASLGFDETEVSPRSINILCNAALVYGYADELKTINVNVNLFLSEP